MKFKGKWLPEKVYSKYRPYCASFNIDTFKQDKNYVGVVGNDTRNAATTSSFYDYIKQNYPELLKYMNKFLTNDLVGNPKVHMINGKFMSCGTLRFVKVLGDIIFKYNINPKTIAEIGCGYGGQAKIIQDYLDVKYTCIDIPEVCDIIKAYSERQGFDVKVEPTDRFRSQGYDLVISDYCLSELDQEGVDTYIDSIILKSKHAYITVNDSAPVLDHLLGRLKEYFDVVLMEDEIPATSRHHNFIIFCK